MRRVTSRLFAMALLVFVLVTPAIADDGSTDPGLWDQFIIWINARIGIPTGGPEASDSITFDEWIALMARIGIPTG